MIFKDKNTLLFFEMLFFENKVNVFYTDAQVRLSHMNHEHNFKRRTQQIEDNQEFPEKMFYDLARHTIAE
jgi:hypothetical protein